MIGWALSPEVPAVFIMPYSLNKHYGIFQTFIQKRALYLEPSDPSSLLESECPSHTIRSLLFFNFLINTEKSSIFFIDYPLNPDLHN